MTIEEIDNYINEKIKLYKILTINFKKFETIFTFFVSY